MTPTPSTHRPPMEYMKIHMQSTVAGRDMASFHVGRTSRSGGPGCDWSPLHLQSTAGMIHYIYIERILKKKDPPKTKQNSFRITANSLESVKQFIFNRGTLCFGLGEGWSGFALHVKPSNEQWSGSSARDPDHKQISVNKFTIKEKGLAILPFAYRRRSFFIKVTNTASEHRWGGGQKRRHLTCLVCVCVCARLNIHLTEFGI